MAEVRSAAVEHRCPSPRLMRALNPAVRWLVSTRAGPAGLVLLHFTGRRSGREVTIPVGYQVIEGVPAVVTCRPWRHNFQGGQDVEVTERGRRRRVRATLVEDPGEVARTFDRMIKDRGWRTVRRAAGLHADGGRTPTLPELEDVVRRSGLSLVRLQPRKSG